MFLCHEGSMPFIKTRIINPLFNRFQMSPSLFMLPMLVLGASVVRRFVRWRMLKLWSEGLFGEWIAPHAWHVYHVCPQHAVQYGKRTKDKGQYFNPNQSTRL